MNTFLALLFAWLFFYTPVIAMASQTPEDHELYGLTGTAILLKERSTGRVLYERNPDLHIYPASMIKVLTAIVMLDHIDPDDMVVVGNEIHHVPAGSSIVAHHFGDHITGLNLLRGLMLPSGNDTANVVAANVARIVNGGPLPFEEAQVLFVELMNAKAREIGLENSHFTNAHGFHDPEMQVTARDLAKLADYALDIPILRQVVSQVSYVGDTVPSTFPQWETLQTRPISWNNTNRLLSGALHNPDVIGLKTGFHTPAGHTFLGAGARDGIELITVIGGSYSETRFVDTTRLLDYGFDNYAFREVHQGGQHVDDITIANPRWGDEEQIAVYSTLDFSYFLSEIELGRVQREISFLAPLMYQPTTYIDNEDEATPAEELFLAPLVAGQVVGQIAYSLDGQLLFTDHLIIAEDVLAWSYAESFQFVINYVQNNPFSIFSLSLLLGFIFLIIMISWTVSTIRHLRRRRKRRRNIQRTKYRV